MARTHGADATLSQDALAIARIAKQVRDAGCPLASYEVVPGWYVFRFAGPRAQTVHADPSNADASSVVAAYLRPPPEAVIERGRAE